MFARAKALPESFAFSLALRVALLTWHAVLLFARARAKTPPDYFVFSLALRVFR